MRVILSSGGRLRGCRALTMAVLAACLPLPATGQTAASSHAGEGGVTYELADYFPSGIGDEWQYRNLVADGLSRIVIRIARDTTLRGTRVWQREEINGDSRLQRVDTGAGLVVHQLAFRDGRLIDYDEPMVLLPARVHVGLCHTSESPYTVTAPGVASTRGRQSYQVCVEQVEDVDTPAGRFVRTLRTRTIALRTDDAGTQKGYELVEWLAPGVGPVKVTGRLSWNDAAGARQRLFRIDAVLEAATVGGRRWNPAPDPSADPAVTARTRALAMTAFGHFRDGLATGQWEPFFAMLADDFTFWFPMGKYLGEHRGKATAMEFFRYVRAVYPDGLFTTLDRVTVDGTRAVFEFRSEGTMVLPSERRPYKNRVTVSMDFRGDQLVGYREYFGSDTRSY